MWLFTPFSFSLIIITVHEWVLIKGNYLIKCCTSIHCYCNSLSWLLPQGDKGDHGLMGPRGIKGHTGHKGDQVCSLFIVIILTQDVLLPVVCVWSCTFLNLGADGSRWSQRKWGKFESTQWPFRFLLLPALVWVLCNLMFLSSQGDPGVAGEPGIKGDQVRNICSSILVTPSNYEIPVCVQ